VDIPGQYSEHHLNTVEALLYFFVLYHVCVWTCVPTVEMLGIQSFKTFCTENIVTCVTVHHVTMPESAQLGSVSKMHLRANENRVNLVDQGISIVACARCIGGLGVHSVARSNLPRKAATKHAKHCRAANSTGEASCDSHTTCEGEASVTRIALTRIDHKVRTRVSWISRPLKFLLNQPLNNK